LSEPMQRPAPLAPRPDLISFERQERRISPEVVPREEPVNADIPPFVSREQRATPITEIDQSDLVVLRTRRALEEGGAHNAVMPCRPIPLVPRCLYLGPRIRSGLWPSPSGRGMFARRTTAWWRPCGSGGACSSPSPVESTAG